MRAKWIRNLWGLIMQLLLTPVSFMQSALFFSPLTIFFVDYDLPAGSGIFMYPLIFIMLGAGSACK